MKNKNSLRSKISLVLFNCLAGFIIFLLIVILGELISEALNISKSFSLGPIHFQIALLGGILQGSLTLLKDNNQPV